MVRANHLTNGYCLKRPSNTCYVFYKKSTSSIQMDLSGMAGSQPALAVDAKLEYAEIDLGTLNPTNQTWTAPYSSDWAIAVGLANAPVPPVIAEVTPDPDTVIAGTEYVKQLTLLQGNPAPSWSIEHTPPGGQVSGNGWVSGWPPAAGDIGSLFTFAIRATNPAGSDSESWQVSVESLVDLDGDGDVDQEDFGAFQVCFSGSAHPCEARCEEADLDSDGDVDGADFSMFQACMGGANQTPGC